MILKGVTIPQGCVVGTGAIVTKPIEQGNVVLAGIPASIVKERIEWKSDRRTNK